MAVERRFTTYIPANGSLVRSPDGPGWHVAFMTQGLTTGGSSASPYIVLLWEREV
jgi:hypothetical protein